MLIGEYAHSLDQKGRLIVPAKFRDGLGAEFVLTRGLDGCITGYSRPAWEAAEARLKALPLAKKEARFYLRFFYSAAALVAIDKQGRVNIPQTLITFAALKKDCQIIGMNDRIEIWSQERWQALAQEFDDGVEGLAEELLDLGL